MQPCPQGFSGTAAAGPQPEGEPEDGGGGRRAGGDREKGDAMKVQGVEQEQLATGVLANNIYTPEVAVCELPVKLPGVGGALLLNARGANV